MNAMDVADRLREMWENNENVMSRILDIKSEIERSGEVTETDKDRMRDLVYECGVLSSDLQKILAEVA